MGVDYISDLLAVLMGASKDNVYLETVEKMQQAFHELILAEADSRRNKVTTLIRSKAKLDAEVACFKKEYERISDQLSQEAVDAIDNYLKIIEQKKKDISYEKNKLKIKRRD